MRTGLRISAIGLVIALMGVGDASQGIRLKTRRLVLEPPAKARQAPKRRAVGRSHWLLEFRGRVNPERLAALADRGARVTSALSANAVAVAAADGTDFRSLGVVRTGRLEAPDKLSPLLASSRSYYHVVEFHSGVTSDDARALVAAGGLEVLEHPDMLPHQLLVAGAPGRLESLAEWDEVAYLFPAAPEMVFGARMAACSGAVMESGPVAQYVKMGNGWGPGALHYFFAGLTRKLDRSTVESEVLRALAEWARYAPLDFTPAFAPHSSRTLSILFARGAHGDGYPFDGPGKVLAHTFYPSPPNPESIAGDMHFDDDESWQVGNRVDLFTVALHEAGHALGLGHSDNPGSVMYPYYRQAAALSADDIAGIQELYGSREVGVTPPEAPPDPPEPPDPPADPGTPDPALALVILTPASSMVVTQAATLAVSGRVEHALGQVEVTWGSSRGPSGSATGEAHWTASVPLSVGMNLLTFRARDQRGATASRSISVTRQETQSAGGTAPPALKITHPALTIISTSQPAITLRGTASAEARQITWSNSAGGSGAAEGTLSWTAAGIPLRVGTNNIVVRAHNAAGAQSWRSITVVRR